MSTHKVSDEILQARARARLKVDAQTVTAAFRSMAAAITERLGDKNPLVLCVLNGGIYPTGLLLPLLDFPLQLDKVHASRYRGDTRGGELQWLSYPGLPLHDRHVLIVDDVLDEGYTLDGIIRHCHDAGAASVTTAVLVDKIHDRKYGGIQADIVGVEAPDEYLFGCGMDYHGYWRNCPAIYAIDASH